MKEPMTEDLLNELLDSLDPAAFASKHKLACRSLPDYLQQLLDERGLRRPEVVRQAGINPTFGYQIFVGQRNPSRNKLLQLAFGMQLGIHDASELLERGGVCRLRPDCRRDLIVAYALYHGLGVEQCDDLLWERGERTIMPGKPRGDCHSQDRPQ